MSSLNFLSRRIKRLAPLYLAGALLGVGYSLWAQRLGYDGDGPVVANLALAVLFIPTFLGPRELYPLNPPSWSLLAELCANLGYGVAVKRASNFSLAAVAAASGVALAILCLTVFHSADAGLSHKSWIGGLARVAFGFPIGVIIHRLDQSGRLKRLQMPPLAALLLVSATFVAPWRAPAYDLLVIVLIYPVVIASSLGHQNEQSAMAKLFAWAGAVSYPLYALQYPLIRMLFLFVQTGRSPPWITVFGAVVFLLGLAAAARRFFDAPLQARLNAA